MKLSTSFLKDYLDYDIDYRKLAEDMTKVGNEYEACYPLIQGTNLIVGEITDCIPHPDSDHLHICQVNIGHSNLQIVCGAPNARTGIKVIVAQIGAVLPNITIKKSSIRGVESNGMLCSLEELGIEHKYLKKTDSGICELPINAKVGDDPRSILNMDDYVIDFELTSNRGDLLSILGMAYEIGAIYAKKVKDIDLTYQENKDDIKNDLNLLVESKKCSLFLAKKVLNVTIKDSPLFIQNRLIASGIRPINNVVDISNYVMLETGQPLHFYDADKLGSQIIVRDGKEAEKLVTLDGIERTINENDLVIADSKEPIGLAGVIGGYKTEVESNTKNIIIESAIFDGISVRLTSKKILRSEASNRFEKGLDPNRTYMALKRSCHLLEKYANATIVGGMLEYNHEVLENKKIDITFAKIDSILGFSIPHDEILDVFKRLGFTYKMANDVIKVSVPRRRMDISIKEDLIEEVGRIYGVDKIKGKLPIMRSKPGSYDKFKRFLRNKLVDLGLNETLSYTLINEKDVYKFTNDNFVPIRVSNPMSEDREVLRHGLIASLYNIYEYNKARNNKDICLFEMSRCFGQYDQEYKEENKLGILLSGQYKLGLNGENIDFYYTKGILEELLHSLGFSYSLVIDNIPKELHPGSSATIMINTLTVGFIGKIHPNITKDDIYVIEINLDLLRSLHSKRVEYHEISKYPSIVKDVAFIISKDITNAEVIKAIKTSGGKYLINIELFDLYEENDYGNSRSLAYNLTFNDKEKTLTDEVVMPIFNKIISDIETKYHAILRNK